MLTARAGEASRHASGYGSVVSHRGLTMDRQAQLENEFWSAVAFTVDIDTEDEWEAIT